MPTNTAFLTDALQEIGIVADGATAESGDLQTALDVMNRMMAEWAISDKNIGYFPQDTLADSVPVPIWAEKGVNANLAVELASVFRVPVTQELLSKAIGGEMVIVRYCINNKLEGANMDNMAIGAGYDRYNIQSDEI